MNLLSAKNPVNGCPETIDSLLAGADSHIELKSLANEFTGVQFRCQNLAIPMIQLPTTTPFLHQAPRYCLNSKLLIATLCIQS